MSQPVIPRNELRSSLTAHLNEHPPPSVAEISRRLGFLREETLRGREPELCKQIAARRREFGARSSAAKQLFKRSEGSRLEDILRRHLAEESPLSLNEIAFKLGYKASSAIRQRFPELCRAIVTKHRKDFIRKRDELLLALEKACAENPPLSLTQVARRFGFSSSTALSTTYPVLCTSHLQRRQVWVEGERNKLRRAIREWVAAQHAPSVTSVCLHFDISPCYFQSRFLEERAEVLRRFAEHARIDRENRAVRMQKEVFELVRKLHEERIFPSLSRVKSMLSRDLAGHTAELRAAIDEALPHFGPIMSHRNELGQFA